MHLVKSRLVPLGTLCLLAIASLLLTGNGFAAPQRSTPAASLGTAITYQGRLNEANKPANGPRDFRFILYDSDAGGTQVGTTIMLDDVQVVNGIFTVPLDFGNIFDGTALWLEVSVRAGTSTGAYTTLSPRQPLTGAPYALHSLSSWNLSGNTGTTINNFLGTTDAQSLILKTNNTEALRIDPNGKVGVGTSSPQAQLDADSGNTGNIAVMGTSTARGVIGRLGIISCPGSYAVGGCAGDTAAVGVQGTSSKNIAVLGISSESTGVQGTSDTGIGIHGASNSNRAIEGFSGTGIGVIGDSSSRGVVGTIGRSSCPGAYAVGGCAGTSGLPGVYGRSSLGTGVLASTDSGDIFLGVTGSFETHQARIDANGKGYFNGGTQGGGADYAESMVAADHETLEPGDVLVIDPQHTNAVRQSREPNTLLVAGVYSTQPSFLAIGQHKIDDDRTGEVPVAMLGIVPTKVTAANGPIQIGDLLVTSSLAGHAMKAQPKMVDGVAIYPTGAILGKALEPLQTGTGIIKVMVTLR